MKESGGAHFLCPICPQTRGVNKVNHLRALSTFPFELAGIEQRLLPFPRDNRGGLFVVVVVVAVVVRTFRTLRGS